MASQIPLVGIEVTTQPTAAFAPIPFLGLDAGVLGTDDEFYYNSTAQALAIPILTGNPATSPAAGSIFLYAVFTDPNYTIRIKTSGGTVVATANLS